MSARSRTRSGNPARRAWDPMTRGKPNPEHRVVQCIRDGVSPFPYRTDARPAHVEAWANRLYQTIVVHFSDGSMHLSVKRHDRAAVRDWRHLQAIKNEVAGADREAVEIFPAESDLLDAANEYHLWVLPPGTQAGVGIHVGGSGLLAGGEYGKARQRDWEPGIPTGLGGAAQRGD